MEETFASKLDTLHKAIKLHISVLGQKFPSSPQGKFAEAKGILTQTVVHIRHLVTKCR